MADDHSAIKYCRADLEVFRKRLCDLESGQLKLGDLIDGKSWRDTTAADIAFTKAKIDELTALLNDYDTRGARRSESSG